jgi:hypothetical protein
MAFEAWGGLSMPKNNVKQGARVRSSEFLRPVKRLPNERLAISTGSRAAKETLIHKREKQMLVGYPSSSPRPFAPEPNELTVCMT